MNSQQKQRYDKTLKETFYLLDRKKVDENFQFQISGSTRNVYTVTIYPKTGTVFCTCPDAKSWAKKHNCICKHSIFLFYRVLKVFDTIHHPFFETLILSEADLENIQSSYSLLDAHLDDRVCNAELTQRYNRLMDGVETADNAGVPAKPFTADDKCGICFTELEESERDHCVSCPVCKNVVHSECNDRWVSTGQQTCVYCRQKVWIKLKTNNGYKNLGF